jgi:hypothetical protein
MAKNRNRVAGGRKKILEMMRELQLNLTAGMVGMTAEMVDVKARMANVEGKMVKVEENIVDMMKDIQVDIATVATLVKDMQKDPVASRSDYHLPGSELAAADVLTGTTSSPPKTGSTSTTASQPTTTTTTTTSLGLGSGYQPVEETSQGTGGGLTRVMQS